LLEQFEWWVSWFESRSRHDSCAALVTSAWSYDLIHLVDMETTSSARVHLLAPTDAPQPVVLHGSFTLTMCLPSGNASVYDIDVSGPGVLNLLGETVLCLLLCETIL